MNCTNSLGDTLSRQMLLNPSGDTTIYASLAGHPTETTLTRLTGDVTSTFADGTAMFTGLILLKNP